MFVALYVLAPWLVNMMLSPEFSDSTIVLRILALSLVAMAIFTAYGNCYLIVVHKADILRKVTVISSLVGFMIAWPMVYNFSFIGAAFTVSITRIILATLTFLAAKGVLFSNCKK